MRRLFVSMFALVAMMIPVHAQEASFDCEITQERFTTRLNLQMPEIVVDAPTQYIVTVIGLDEFSPVLGTTLADDTTFCTIGDTSTAPYELLLPATGDIAGEVTAAQEFVDFAGQNSMQVGEIDNQAGEFMLLVEGLFDAPDSDSQQYRLNVTDAMLAAGMPVSVYLFALTPDVQARLTVTAPDESVAETQALEEGTQLRTDYVEVSRAEFVSLPAIGGDFTLSVESDSVASYVLLIHAKTGNRVPGDGIATVTENADSALSLSCDGQPVFDNGIEIMLPDDAVPYTITVLGSDTFDAVMAVVDEKGQGTCYDNTPESSAYGVDLPTIGLQGDFAGAQAVAESRTRRVVIGSHDNLGGEFVAMIEGGTVESGDAGDVFTLYVTPGMFDATDFQTVYSIAAVNDFDPVIERLDADGAIYLDADGLPVTCDNAGLPDMCYGQTTSLRESALMLADDHALPGFELDAMLTIAMDADIIGESAVLRFRASESYSGPYIAVFHIVTE